MFSLSTIGKAFLVSAALLLPPMGAARSQSWPVKGEIDLSSGFCDFRAAHFHGGIDIRTGGAEGREVYSPVDGYIWRIRYSYSGYGKALYLKDNNGFIYVFGHLSRLSESLEKMVKSEQYRLRRYYLDWQFDPDSIPVRRGESIAFSGQTGSGAPHLHFEKRTPDNKPLNPLTNGFPLKDEIRPKIEAIGFCYIDSISLFPNGRRNETFRARYDRSSNAYVLDTAVFLTAPFGLKIKAYDQIRAGGPKLSIRKISLFIDNSDEPWFESVFDQYDYGETRMVDLTFDYYSAVKNKDYYYLLFEPSEKSLSANKSNLFRGVIDRLGPNSTGLRFGRVEVYDAAGNKSELIFSFVLSPYAEFFNYSLYADTLLTITAKDRFEAADLEAVKVSGYYPRAGWRTVGERKNNQVIECRLLSSRGDAPPVALKIELIGKTKWRHVERFLLLSPPKNGDIYSFAYDLIDNGILFSAASVASYAPPPAIRVVCENDLSRTIQMTPSALNKYLAFFRGRDISSKIVRLELIDPQGRIAATKEVNIFLAGISDAVAGITGDMAFGLNMKKSDYYSPAFIELRKASHDRQVSETVLSDEYEITPFVFPLAQPISISINFDGKTDLEKIGIGRKAENGSWQWIKAASTHGKFAAESGKFGRFALIRDDVPPNISNLRPAGETSIASRFPRISCQISDNLSGVGSDENITVLLDGQWLIPEYDPETTQLKTYPREKLSKGKHQLEITVSDGAGNRKSATSIFYVK
jgi:hypothetical protein